MNSLISSFAYRSCTPRGLLSRPVFVGRGAAEPQEVITSGSERRKVNLKVNNATNYSHGLGKFRLQKRSLLPLWAEALYDPVLVHAIQSSRFQNQDNRTSSQAPRFMWKTVEVFFYIYIYTMYSLLQTNLKYLSETLRFLVFIIIINLASHEIYMKPGKKYFICRRWIFFPLICIHVKDNPLKMRMFQILFGPKCKRLIIY